MICLPALIWALPGKDFTKSIVREFEIARDGIVGVDNIYGNVDIRTWDASRVKIEVTIKVDARNEESANEMFDRISVSFDNSTAAVRANTSIKTVTGWKSWFKWGSDSDKFEINYVVFTPASVELELKNKYGDIYVPDMSGRVKIGLKYGDMRLGGITGFTAIDMAYADGVVGSVKDLHLDMSYSDLSLASGGNITFTGKYSDIQIGSAADVTASTGYVDLKADRIGHLQSTGKYDDYVVGELGSLEASSKYTGYQIGRLREFARVDVSYGSMNLKEVQAGFTSIDITSAYTDVSMEIEDSAVFVFDVSGKFCDVRHYGMEVLRERDESFERQVSGYRGSSVASARVKAVLSYGSFTIR